MVQEDIPSDYIMLTPQVTYYRCLKGFENSFLKLCFESPKFQNQMKFIGGEGTTRAYVGLLAQRDIVLDFPKEIAEQKSIVEKADILLGRNSKTIINSQKEIELLKEYKQSLITNVVTGKVDVRDEVIA